MLKQSQKTFSRTEACLKSAKKKFVHNIKINLSTEELKAVAKIRNIKGYKSMSEDKLLRAFTPSKPKKQKIKNQKKKISKARIEKIRKEFNKSRYKFRKLRIKEIRKNLYEIENEKNLSKSKIKEIERNLTELEEYF